MPQHVCYGTATPSGVVNNRGSFGAEAVLSEATRAGVAFTYKSYWPKRGGGAISTPQRPSATLTWGERLRSTTTVSRSSASADLARNLRDRNDNREMHSR